MIVAGAVPQQRVQGVVDERAAQRDLLQTALTMILGHVRVVAHEVGVGADCAELGANLVRQPRLAAGQKSGPAARPRAEGLLHQLGLEERASHRPSELSGGEQQRVAVARALMNEPGLVLADEPTGNLDTKTAESLHNEILRLSRTTGQTFVVVTHNPALAAIADRVLRIENGLLEEA